jgi:hypothetical protein
MSIITTGELTVVLDKMARYVSEAVGDQAFDDAFTAGLETAAQNVLSGSNGLATYLLTISDVDVLADFMPAARDLDENHPTPPDGFLLKIAEVTALVTGMNNHFKLFGYKGVDDYLTQLNAVTPTLRAHGHFKKYLSTITAGNSFIPADVDLATLDITGAAAGTFTHLTKIDKTKYAGAKLVVVNVGALASAPVISVTGVKLDGTTATLTATLATNTDAHETNLSDTTKKFIDVTAISVSSLGTGGDKIKIRAKTDRDISAA